MRAILSAHGFPGPVRSECKVGIQVSQSIDLDLRELRQAGERLEDATKDWVLAYRLYVGAVDAL